MRTSYRPEDVTMLLKDITGLVTPMENIDRERMIQSGVHYSEMIPKEHAPSDAYLQTFHSGLQRFAKPTAKAVEIVSEQILQDKGEKAVLVSLARVGTPIGILIKHYIKQTYGVDVPHYTISIIRGKGIDKNAVRRLLQHHQPEQLQFVDGWTGKGAIQRQLAEAMKEFPHIDEKVAVLSDPAHVSGKCGTHLDFMIPSSCLNSTVSGLISRTFCRNDIIHEHDFHGALYYEEFEQQDLSYLFLDTIEQEFHCDYHFPECVADARQTAFEEVKAIAETFHIRDINFVKPSIGETTRVLLRRIPWKILVHSLDDTEHLGHIYQLAREKHIPVEVYPFVYYQSCGLIRDMADQ